jgi:hypothetical protein
LAETARRPTSGGRDRAVTRGRENRKLPTDLNPPLATTSYHKKVTCVSKKGGGEGGGDPPPGRWERLWKGGLPPDRPKPAAQRKRITRK